MRYLPHSDSEIKEMLEAIGVDDIEELFRSIPQSNRCIVESPSSGLTEHVLRRSMEELSGKNVLHEIMLAGSGASFHSIPSAVDNIISRSEFLTAYTPYQPEVSQGTLQAVFEFQTMVCELFGMDVSNASMYDGASALGEAILMANRIHKGKRSRVLVSRAINPNYLSVVKTMVESFGGIEIEFLDIDPDTGETIYPEDFSADISAVAVPYPGFFGVIENLETVTSKCSENGVLSICSMTDISLLSLFKSPGELGFDIATGEGMGLAGTSGMGGPSLGLMACKTDYTKQMPGRIVGQTIDSNGEDGYVLTLATREQHIKREKATSNICSNQALVALAFTVHMSLLGPDGFRNLGAGCKNATDALVKGLASIEGVKKVYSGPYFNEVTLSFRCDTRELRKYLSKHGILLGVMVKWFYPELQGADDMLVINANEMISDSDITKTIDLVRDFMEGGAR
ncbi:MAG: aminomethyl-transferring glycine dehydrogenase subunit GcvPA [Deltaproteobacteria bacterium]|nr:aminomethyl-transferring glycine dehydrogenase subunit GcvPA [Deltaproteobacteria bacterium]